MDFGGYLVTRLAKVSGATVFKVQRVRRKWQNSRDRLSYQAVSHHGSPKYPVCI